jgi:4-amino-4-deoxy-L-arabinose transferase-like glycosyltransferase
MQGGTPRWIRRRNTQELLIWGVIGVVVFWRLGYVSLLDPDEAHYAQLTREMVGTRQWLIPTLEGVPFIDKPVLYHWLQAAAEWLFGENEFALRLPSAIAAVVLIWTVRWIGQSVADRSVGNRAALFFATTPLTFALASIGVFDMLYTAFLFGAIGSLLVASSTGRRRLEYLGWPLLALAVMTKGPVALVLALLFAVALVVRRDTRPLVRNLHWELGLLFVALVASPWFLYMTITFGRRFVRDYLLGGNLYYFTRPAAFSSRDSGLWFYMRSYFGGCFPWSLLLTAAAIDTWRTRRVISPFERALWVWIALILVFFSIAGFKLDTYIFPVAPATGLVLALAWRWSKQEMPQSIGMALWIVAAAFVVAGGVLWATMFRINLELSSRAVLLPCALISGGLILGWHLKRAIRPLAWVLIAVMVSVYGVVLIEGLPVLERSRPTAPLGRWLARHAPADAPVGVYGLDDWRGSIRFYSRRHLQILHDQSEVREFFDRYPDSYALMLARDYRRLRSAGIPLGAIGGRRAIVGRSGKYIRKQIWDRIVVTTPPVVDAELVLSDSAISRELKDE